MNAKAAKRCAIYVRKSTTQGLEQEFNSLDAQREACAAYIRGQPGWALLPTTYEDGGFSGATTDRPAFQRLLGDIDAGAVDVVVVYKVDRLSRSLLDFAKVMDRFNARNVAFVSVTQNFSTADAIGRLTLNMMMSFAEFEREMIAERTRDKIRASRKKGKWTGGPQVLGYEVVDQKLVVNDVEAEQVRTIFALYLDLGSLHRVIEELNARGITLKRYVTKKTGKVREPPPWDADALIRLLRNPVYAGLIPCYGEVYPGEHQPIIPKATWELVGTLLDSPRSELKPSNGYLLKGILRCGSCGGAMVPTQVTKGGKQYRYYRCLIRLKRGKASCTSRFLPADDVDCFVAAQVTEAAENQKLADEVVSTARAKLARDQESLLEERKRLTGAIGRSSEELRRLVERARTLDGEARQVVEEAAAVTHDRGVSSERRLSEVERRLVEIRRVSVEAEWVGRALADFGKVWASMNDDNRHRLLLALIEKVVVDEASGEVAVTLASLSVPTRNAVA